MPVSDEDISRRALDLIRSRGVPKRILDIGVGYGFYGKSLKALRADADVYGVEIFAPYITNQLDFYKTVFLCDARRFEYEMLGKMDLVIAADVVEHFHKDEAVALFAKLRTITDWIVVTMPLEVKANGLVYFMPQGPSNNNVYESHLHQWTREEVENDLMLSFVYQQQIPKICALFEWRRK